MGSEMCIRDSKQIQEIIEIKGNDLNAVDDEAAFNIIAGTARSMGLEVE